MKNLFVLLFSFVFYSSVFSQIQRINELNNLKSSSDSFQQVVILVYHCKDGTTPIPTAELTFDKLHEKTDSLGMSVFYDVRIGKHIVTASKAGYYTYVREINVQDCADLFTIFLCDSFSYPELHIINGSPSGLRYSANQSISIKADIKIDSVFLKWTGDTSHLVTGIYSSTGTVVMPSHKVHLCATYILKDTGLLNINVKNDKDLPLIQTKVMIYNIQNNYSQNTDLTGNVSIELPFGEYYIIIKADSFYCDSSLYLLNVKNVIRDIKLQRIPQSNLSYNNTNDLSFYPNPVNNILHIKNCKNYEIAILNNVGMNVINKQIEKDNEDIDVSYLPNGLYFLKFIKEDEIIIKKIMKQ